MILQDVCREKLDWDDPLNETILKRWMSWKSGLNVLEKLSIPRCYLPSDFGTPTTTQIHTFSDASTEGYGQCAYLRFVNAAKRVHVTLVSSKARVTPLKSVTVPRLELQAARSAIDLSAKVTHELALGSVDRYFYSDSEVVLGYIKNTETRFHTYVANRVDQIRDRSDPSMWFHVPTNSNPADYASRGLSPSQILSSHSDWFEGPSFLQSKPIILPPQPKLLISPEDTEVKVVLTTQTRNVNVIYQICSAFSTLKRAIKAVSGLQSLITHKNPINPQERERKALVAMIKSAQAEHFIDEISCLSKTQPYPVPKGSSIAGLNPFLDEHGCLRVGGRLNHSDLLSFDEKHPLLLPKKSHLTNLIIDHHHTSQAHLAADFTLSSIRSHGLWIPAGKSAVSSRTRACITCKKNKGKPITPQMATLPASRVNQAPPFTDCGVDCFGPFLVKDGRKESKRYGLIVSCLASRAVHIEMLEDMTTDSYINAVRTLVAIRGPIRSIISDQGTNFIGGAKELESKLESCMQITIKFNQPHSSNMGGVWERQIRTIRSIFSSLATKYGGRLSTQLLRTIFYEVMAIINCRPLTSVSSDSLPLTPNMILTMKSDVILPPPGQFSDADIYTRKRWRAVQQVANEFWQRWRKEYLHELQTRQKWVNKSPPVSVGDVVIVCDDDVVRNEWKMARVVECVRSHDDQVRSLKLLIADRNYPQNKGKRQYLVRPVSKVVLLVKTTQTQ